MPTNNVIEKNTGGARMIRPRYTIRVDEGLVRAIIEMPGVPKDGVSMTIENNELRLIGTRSDVNATGTYLLRERNQGDYYQTFTLDETIDQTNIDAVLEKGVLTILMQLKEEVKPKTIEVKSL